MDDFGDLYERDPEGSGFVLVKTAQEQFDEYVQMRRSYFIDPNYTTPA